MGPKLDRWPESKKAEMQGWRNLNAWNNIPSLWPKLKDPPDKPSQGKDKGGA